MINVTIVGWHLNTDAAVCNDCDNPAAVVVQYEADGPYYDTMNLCNDCLNSDTYHVVDDRIEQIFRDLGL